MSGNAEDCKKKTLVVGGAGYIGSHVANMLVRRRRPVIILDDLSSGHDLAATGAPLIRGDFGDRELLSDIFAKHDIGAVMHFAASIQVGESVAAPARYYDNNVAKTLRLLDAMRAGGVDRFIFSSSAAIFGSPDSAMPIPADFPAIPINPYGRTKWFVEEILADYDRAYGLRSICLRYFNAAGADPDGGNGVAHEPDKLLIPMILRAAMRGEAVAIYGDDYDTVDGTCVRDYVHVCDLAAAHLAALDALQAGGDSARHNLGNGAGFSVRQVVETARAVTGLAVKTRSAPRRPGDPSVLVADSSSARRQLRWAPRYPDLNTIIAHSWRRILHPREGNCDGRRDTRT